MTSEQKRQFTAAHATILAAFSSLLSAVVVTFISGAFDKSTTEIERLKGELGSLEMERTRYRADSRFISQWLGLGIGVLVALVGVRVLGNIVDISTLTGPQVGIFVVVDIMLTGAVLAGGSEAINKIMKVYNSFMISTAEKASIMESGESRI